MKTLSVFLLLTGTVLVASCAARRDAAPLAAWELQLRADVARTGAGNWIVVADAAFPVMSRSGVRTIVADANVPEVLDVVLRQMERTEHVKPRFYVAQELANVSELFAPGERAYETSLQRSLRGYQTIQLRNRALMTLLTDAKKTFQVLVVKTKTTLPYSSVFIELDSGYWDSEAEGEMRDRMEARLKGL